MFRNRARRHTHPRCVRTSPRAQRTSWACSPRRTDSVRRARRTSCLPGTYRSRAFRRNHRAPRRTRGRARRTCPVDTARCPSSSRRRRGRRRDRHHPRPSPAAPRRPRLGRQDSSPGQIVHSSHPPWRQRPPPTPQPTSSSSLSWMNPAQSTCPLAPGSSFESVATDGWRVFVTLTSTNLKWARSAGQSECQAARTRTG